MFAQHDVVQLLARVCEALIMFEVGKFTAVPKKSRTKNFSNDRKKEFRKAEKRLREGVKHLDEALRAAAKDKLDASAGSCRNRKVRLHLRFLEVTLSMENQLGFHEPHRKKLEGYFDDVELVVRQVSPSDAGNYRKQLETLRKALESQLTEEERHQIKMAMSSDALEGLYATHAWIVAHCMCPVGYAQGWTGQGHFFQCPNGHPCKPLSSLPSL